MADSRTKNTKRNIVTSYLNLIVTMPFKFITRPIILHILGSEYLGLSSLFGSILQVLGLVDLGFASAIAYSLYKPIAENDVEKVCSLLEYLKKIYRVVGTVMLVGGIALIPFLHLLIKGSVPTDMNLYILYLMYLINTVVSYFLFAYKSTLLSALQRDDLVKNIYTIITVVQNLLQILVLVIFKNFYLFVLVYIISSTLQNIAGEYISRKYYPQFICKGKVDDETKKDIVRRVKGIFICKISGNTYTTFDSIIISSLIGLGAVAIYNNYLVIFTTVVSFITIIRSAMQASVGNKVAIESKQKNYEDVFLWQFMFSSIVMWCVCCMICLFQPFMEIWMGKDMLLPFRDVVLLCAWFGINQIQHAFYLYLGGNGLWWELRWSYIISTIQNIILNIVLGKFFGTTGIIFSSLLASLVFGLIWQCIVIFKVYFNRSPFEYYKKQLFYFILTIIVCVISYYLCSIIGIDGVVGLIIKGLICTIITAITILLVFGKTAIFKRTIVLLKNRH